MEFLIELLFETLDEFFLEGGIERAADRSLPKWARVLILIVSALVFAAVFGIILVVGVKSLRKSPLLSVLMFALAAGLVFLCTHKVRKILRTLSQ